MLQGYYRGTTCYYGGTMGDLGIRGVLEGYSRGTLGYAARVPVERRRRTVFIARPAAARGRPRGRSCVRVGLAVLIRRPRVRGCGSVRSAGLCVLAGIARIRPAGATWTGRATGAPWAARYGHTSVIDAAGAIYVIGGQGGGSTLYRDVWVSINGGA